jgi:acetyltransferase-like isoleucine patch superfamily enzyme
VHPKISVPSWRRAVAPDKACGIIDEDAQACSLAASFVEVTMPTIRDAALAVIWALPASPAKNAVLRRFGNRIEKGASLGSCLVWHCGKFDVGENVQLGSLNVFKGLAHVQLDAHVQVGSFNWSSAGSDFEHQPGYGRLSLHEQASMTSRHFLDCTGGVTIGAYATIAGLRTAIITHGIDVGRNTQTSSPVSVGPYSLVGTCSILLAGSTLPDRSVLAAGSVLTAADDLRAPGLYAGVPARFKKPVSGDYFNRPHGYVRVPEVPAADTEGA